MILKYKFPNLSGRFEIQCGRKKDFDIKQLFGPTFNSTTIDSSKDKSVLTITGNEFYRKVSPHHVLCLQDC